MKKGLHIAFFGRSLLSSYRNAGVSYFRGIVRALDQRGHRITFYEPVDNRRSALGDLRNRRWAWIVAFPPNQEGAWCALERARRADIIIKASDIGTYDTLLDQAIPDVAAPSAITVYWDLDAPGTLKRIKGGLESMPIRKYDIVLTCGGSESFIQRYRRVFARHCMPIFPAADPRVNFSMVPGRRYKADLAFLGNRYTDRENRMRCFFFDVARWLPRKHFLLGGSGWENQALPPNVEYLGHVSSVAHNAFNSTPNTILNVCREGMIRGGRFPAARMFEAASSGACLISDRWEGLEQFFTPGDEILVADDSKDIAQYLTTMDIDTAAALGRHARQRVMAEHTYAHRAAELEAILCGYDRARLLDAVS